MKVVLANGVFDLLHVAHLRYLQEARRMGDRLVVGVVKDSHVNKGTGRPIIPQEERVEVLLGLSCVSNVMLVRDGVEALRRARPDIFCAGHDNKIRGLNNAEVKYCKEHDVKIRFTQPNPQTTSKIIKRIKCVS